jgi:hypothetical protein
MLKMYEKYSLLRYQIVIHTLLTMYEKKFTFTLLNQYQTIIDIVIDNIDIDKKVNFCSVSFTDLKNEKAFLDFYINDNLKWGFELLCKDIGIQII